METQEQKALAAAEASLEACIDWFTAPAQAARAAVAAALLKISPNEATTLEAFRAAAIAFHQAAEIVAESADGSEDEEPSRTAALAAWAAAQAAEEATTIDEAAQAAARAEAEYHKAETAAQNAWDS